MSEYDSKNVQELSWGELIRSKRIEKGLTQAELSQLLNYPNPQFVSLIERSLSKIPLTTLGRLIQILDLNEEQIILRLVDEYTQNVRQEIRKGQTQSLNLNIP